MAWRIPNPSGENLFFKINGYGHEHRVLRKRFGSASCMIVVLLNGVLTTFHKKVNRVCYSEAPLDNFIQQLINLKFKISKQNIRYIKTKKLEYYITLELQTKNFYLKVFLYYE